MEFGKGDAFPMINEIFFLWIDYTIVGIYTYGR